MLILPDKSDAERAIKRLKEAEEEFRVALEQHEAEVRRGGQDLQSAADFSAASVSYRLALLDPRLPPV